MSHPDCKSKRSFPTEPTRALYIHVPFCLRKCRYCDFYSTPINDATADRFVEALGRELRLQEAQLQAPLESVYVGGGTPTSLGARRLSHLLGMIRPLLDRRTEFTVEANPGLLDELVAGALAQAGANRVSLGAQTFDAGQLRLLGRLHDVDQPRQAVQLLRRAGIANISLDLIYGIPGQTLESWQASLEKALELEPQHLSCYSLSFEPGTALCAQVEAGLLRPVDDSVQEACYRWTIQRCLRGGLEHYEISNWARPGRPCRHNLTYWGNLPYLGLGPAAASYIGGVRHVNRPDLEAYLAALSQGQSPPGEAEQLVGRPQMAETLMLGLRLLEGVDRAEFARRFGQDVMEAFPRSLKHHQQLGMVIVSDDCIRLSPKALFVSDSVLADIVDEA